MTSDIPKILIVRTFNHPAERLFKAWTDPQDLGTWMWNPYDRNLDVEVDLRVGGRYRIYTDAPPDQGKPGDRWGMVGFYTEVVTNKRLAYTLHWDAPVGYNEPGMNPLDEVLVCEFQLDGEGSLLKYTHMGIPDDGGSAAEHERSVRETLDLLEAHLKAT